MNTPNGWSLANMIQFFETDSDNEKSKQLAWLVLIAVYGNDENLKSTERWWK